MLIFRGVHVVEQTPASVGDKTSQWMGYMHHVTSFEGVVHEN